MAADDEVFKRRLSGSPGPAPGGFQCAFFRLAGADYRRSETVYNYALTAVMVTAW